MLVGLAGVVVACVITPYSSLYLNSSQLGDDYLPIGVFSLFLVLLGLNAGLRLFGIGLSRADLFLAYLTMLVSAAIPVSGFATRVLPALAGQYYWATEENRWAEYFWRFIPSWIGPQDHDIARTFYEGSPDGSVPWGAWLVPLATWLVPFAGVGLMLFALGILLRRQWIHYERLVFPLAQVPLTLTGEEETPSFNGQFWRKHLFWIALMVPFLINSLNGVHHFFLVVPNIPAMDPALKPSLGGFLQDPLWQYMYRDFFFEFHFALIGVAMMMRQEVSLSLWFFQVFFGVVLFFFLVSGIGPGQYMYTPRETFGYVMFARWTKFGASLVVAGLILWSLRHTLLRAGRLMGHPFRRSSGSAEEDDRLLRWPLWMFGVGLVAYLLWTHAIGLALFSAVGMLFIALVAFLVVARIVSEGGLIWCSVALDPIFMWPTLVGTASLSPQTITALAYTGFVPLAARGNVLPSIMDALKISHASSVRPRHALVAMALSLFVAVGVSIVVVLVLTYDQGANFMPWKHYSYGPRWLFGKTTEHFTTQVGPSEQAIATMFAGMAIMAVLYKLHRRYLWWPFYPLGYVIAETEVMQHQWLSIFIGWAVRTIVVRVGGAIGYRNMRPAALGVIVGDLVSVFVWFVIYAITGTTGQSMTHDTSTW